jgi:hypothetical protein
VYTAKEPELYRTESDIDLALEILILANQWSMMELHRVVQFAMISLKMVDPFNLDHSKLPLLSQLSTKVIHLF